MIDTRISTLYGYNLNELEPNYRKYLGAEKISLVTVKNYCSDLRYFIGWYQTYFLEDTHDNSLSTFVSKSSSNLLEAYSIFLHTENFPFRTIKRRMSSLRKFFLFCVSEGILDELPTVKEGHENIDHQFELLADDYANYLSKTSPLNDDELEDVQEFLSIAR